MQTFSVAFAAWSPEMQQKALRIRARYEANKRARKDTDGEANALSEPGGEVLAGDYQWLHSFSKNSARYFVCRNLECRAFCLNTHWVSTAHAGGWHFACPLCGTWFKKGKSGEQVLPAHFIWVWKMGGQVKYLLAEWPASDEEDYFARMMEVAHAEVTEEMKALPQAELHKQLAAIVETTSQVAELSEHKFKEELRSWFDAENQKRSRTAPPRSLSPTLIFQGAMLKNEVLCNYVLLLYDPVASRGRSPGATSTSSTAVAAS